jgi:hypothetical protein
VAQERILKRVAQNRYADVKEWVTVARCQRMYSTMADVSAVTPAAASARRPGCAYSMEAVEFAPLEWVDWYNTRRLLQPIGNIPPAEAEARYYAQLEAPAMAA